MSDQTILVLGAGELGMAVLEHLSKRAPHPGTISVLLRPSAITSNDPSKAQQLSQLRSLGVSLVPGDLVASSTAELSTIFKPFHTILSCTGFVTGSGGLQVKLARAVLHAGVKRYFPWQFGVDYDIIGRGSAQDLFDEQLDVRDLLRGQSSTQWVIISTGMFTSFLFEPSFGVVDITERTVHCLGSWDTAVTLTTPEDIGMLTAEILFAEPRITNTIVYTAGDTVTYGKAADIVDDVLNTKVRRIEWSMPFLREELAKDPGNPIKKYRVVFGDGKGVAWDVQGTFNGKKRIKVMDVGTWARENLK